jgi:hypothetical protein
MQLTDEEIIVLKKKEMGAATVDAGIEDRIEEVAAVRLLGLPIGNNYGDELVAQGTQVIKEISITDDFDTIRLFRLAAQLRIIAAENVFIDPKKGIVIQDEKQGEGEKNSEEPLPVARAF